MVIIKRGVKKISIQYYSQKKNEVKNKNAPWRVYKKQNKIIIIIIISSVEQWKTGH